MITQFPVILSLSTANVPPKFPLHFYAKWQRDRRARWEVQILRQLRARAKQRGLAFDLTAEDLVIPERCPVLGIKLRFRYTTNELTGRIGPDTPSVDRFDNRLGYVKGNVRIISYRANSLKNDATLNELRAVVAYMEGLTSPPVRKAGRPLSMTPGAIAWRRHAAKQPPGWHEQRRLKALKRAAS